MALRHGARHADQAEVAAGAAEGGQARLEPSPRSVAVLDACADRARVGRLQCGGQRLQHAFPIVGVDPVRGGLSRQFRRLVVEDLLQGVAHVGYLPLRVDLEDHVPRVLGQHREALLAFPKRLAGLLALALELAPALSGVGAGRSDLESQRDEGHHGPREDHRIRKGPLPEVRQRSGPIQYGDDHEGKRQELLARSGSRRPGDLEYQVCGCEFHCWFRRRAEDVARIGKALAKDPACQAEDQPGGQQPGGHRAVRVGQGPGEQEGRQ